MMSDEIVLCEGCPGDDDGEGWMPRIALDHGPTDSGSELYVIVGEEIAGMAEGVDAPTFEAIRAATFTPQERAALLKVVMGDYIDPNDNVRALNTAIAKLR